MACICHNSFWTKNKIVPLSESDDSLHQKVNDFKCRIFLQDSQFCKEKRKKKKQQINVACINIERLERLSRPKVGNWGKPQTKSPGMKLECLLPRLSQLSKPKCVTQKYVKPPEEPILLPGKIKDWKAHKEWLVKHARPRKDHTKLDAKSFNETSQKLTREGLMRIQKLAKPLSRYRKSKIKPISRRFMRVVGFANERVIELSRPKCRFDRNDEYLPEAPKVSKSAMSYEASERIKALAQPKKFIRCPFNSNEDLSQDFNCKCICCNHSQSCVDLSDCSNDFSSCASVSSECEESDSIRKGTPEDGSICEVSCESVSQSMDCTEQ